MILSLYLRTKSSDRPFNLEILYQSTNSSWSWKSIKCNCSTSSTVRFSQSTVFRQLTCRFAFSGLQSKPHTSSQSQLQSLQSHSTTGISLTIKDTNEYVDLMQHTRLCTNKKCIQVLAKQLVHGVKIFTPKLKDSYIVGNQGDYIVVNCDDKTEISIIEQNLFQKLYRQK